MFGLIYHHLVFFRYETVALIDVNVSRRLYPSFHVYIFLALQCNIKINALYSALSLYKLCDILPVQSME